MNTALDIPAVKALVASPELPQLTEAQKDAAYSIGKQYGLSRGQSCLIVRTALAAKEVR